MAKRKILGPAGHYRQNKKLKKLYDDAYLAAARTTWPERPRQFDPDVRVDMKRPVSSAVKEARQALANQHKQMGLLPPYPRIAGDGLTPVYDADENIRLRGIVRYQNADYITTERGVDKRMDFASGVQSKRAAGFREGARRDKIDEDWYKRAALVRGVTQDTTPGTKYKRRQALSIMDAVLDARPARDDLDSYAVDNDELTSPDRRKPGRVRYQQSAEDRRVHRRRWLAPLNYVAARFGKKISKISPSQIKRGRYGPWREE